MKFLPSLLALGAMFDASLAAPPSALEPRACTTPKVRKNWASATTSEKSAYINAVKCLTTKPSKLGKSHRLYDDFVWVHATLFQQIHNVAAFLPWHRYFLTLYETSLRQCGYTGNMMYWDWVADSAKPSKAKVFDPTTGFGGNGNQTSSVWGTKCVLTGPFSKSSGFTLRYWNDQVRPHCLLRMFEPGYPEYNITEMYGDNYSPSVMASVNAETTFDGFANYLENGPHTAVHSGVGNLDGDMGPQSSSPNDPLFFLHHTQVDRLWYLWQRASPGARTLAYGGYKWPDYSPAGLDDIMPMLGLGADAKVRTVMDVNASNLCYKY
ncbi:hypothetical protein QBC37DRAFT_426191 [Rhypophila decipiens]|uniref:Tyrosinase copper-binding domain-containing protein n=1 Tax=Rhypophila decipiens TaxID=261697 RepID=A0AAN6Y3Z0_9PEZI|nr:hypothetical protein QBC37DRAFT_426191 [Rhypophila decipiens]